MTKRRSFLKSLVAAPVALAPAAYSFAQEISPDTIWDKETDVVVVGSAEQEPLLPLLLSRAAQKL